MSCFGFDNISTIPEILIRIYEQLTFLDQLRLSRVNQQLKNIFFSFIYPKDYRVLQIHTTTEVFFVNNELDTNRVVLTPEELREFVCVYGENVEELSEDMIMTHAKQRTQNPDMNVEQFRNLTCLKYMSLLIQDEHVQLIAENCWNLEELHLINCSRAADVEFLRIGHDLSIKTLQKIQKLKTLAVDGYCLDETLRYSVFSELITKLNLECLILGAVLIPDMDTPEAETDYVHHHLKELKISTSFDSDVWGNNFPSFLRIFENISILTLSTPDNVTDKILEIIAKSCKNLEKFTIGAFTKFRNIKQFSMPPNVREFALDECRGLTYNNLKEILTQFKIQKFTSGRVNYLGAFYDFAISPFIQVLDLPQVNFYNFPSAYVNNRNMKELHWYANDHSSSKDPAPLETCTNLESLKMSCDYTPLESILQLEKIKKLTILQTKPHLSWSFVTALMKHQPLTELEIDARFDIHFSNDLLNSLHPPTQGFRTNVKTIKLDLKVFESGLDFWLDLWNKNPDITYICKSCGIEYDYEFLRKLVDHIKFPRYLRTIDVWGFSVNCKDVRNNLTAIKKLFFHDMKRITRAYIRFKKIDRIVLSRKHSKTCE